MALFLAGSIHLHAEQFGDFTYSSDGTSITITGYGGVGGDVVVPEVIEALPVRHIASEAFNKDTTITGITIPEGVTEIRRASFSECTNLISARLPNGVTIIGGYAFYRCASLRNVNIPESAKYIDDLAFFGCASLENMVLSSRVYSIGGHALHGCTNLRSIKIPDSVYVINDFAFQNCTSLTTVALPDSIGVIGRGAFMGCSNLSSVYFAGNAPSSYQSGAFIGTAPGFAVFYYSGLRGFSSPTWRDVPAIALAQPKEGDFLYHREGDTITITGYSGIGERITIPSTVEGMPVRRIGASAFEGNIKIISVTIPQSVVSIGSGAFRRCSELLGANFQGAAPSAFGSSIGSTVFSEVAPKFRIFYFSGSVGFMSPLWNNYAAVDQGPTFVAWREQHFGVDAGTLPTAADEADPDGDGFTNAQEYAVGSDPQDSGSRLQVGISWVPATSGSAAYVVLTVLGQPGRRYEVQRMIPISGGTWRKIIATEAQQIAGPLSLTTGSVPDGIALYRVIVAGP